MCALAVAVVALLGGCGDDKPASSSASTWQETTQSATSANGDTVRYLALGDSLTQEVSATDEQTGAFPSLLAEKWRSAGCEVELMNVGVSGYTAGQVLAEQVPQIEPFNPR